MTVEHIDVVTSTKHFNTKEYNLLGCDAVSSVQLQLNRLHGVTSQKMILSITIAVETSNPTLQHCLRHYIHLLLVYSFEK
jgi:hypothetical protein